MSQTENKQEITSHLDIVNALKEEFSTSVNRIYIHTLDREVGFREVRVAEQKSLTKIMVENEDKEDVIYDTTLAMIKTLCLEEIDFDVLTEFDRIKIMLELYQGNFFRNDIDYKCRSCGADNKFSIDFEGIINKMNETKFDDVIVKTEDADRIYEFIVNFPTIKRMANFMKDMVKSRRLSKRDGHIKLDKTDMFDLFIKSFTVENKAKDGKVINVNCEALTTNELEETLQVLPQVVLYSDEGVLGKINDEVFMKVDEMFQNPKCNNCGVEEKEVIGLTDFFI